MADNNNTLAAANALIIEKSASIPVLAGKPTLSGVYVHNTTGKAISGIYYALIQNGSTNSISIDSHSCTTIAANSSCLLPLTTPALDAGNSGSNVIVANYDDLQSKQLINYHYVNTGNYTGINFSDGSQILFGTNDYATVYVFAGKSQSYTNIGFNMSNDSLAITNGLINGKVDIPANQVVSLEIQSNQNVTSNLISVTPYSSINSNKLTSSLSQQLEGNAQLQVVITPKLQANLLMSNLPILTQSSPSTTLTIINNGNQNASTIGLNSGSSNVAVTAATTNPCGSSLAVGASCNYTITLNNSTTNGSALLTLAYNNTQSSVTATQVAYYKNNPSEPMVTAAPMQTSLTEKINTSQNILFHITNTSSVALNNPQINIKTTLANTYLSPYQNNCSNTVLNPNSSCSLYVVVAASDLIDSGAIYLTVTGSYTGTSTNNYSFASNAVYTTVYDPSIPTVTSTTPQDAQTNVNNSSSIVVNFSESMTPTTLNNTTILLRKVSDGSSVALTSQGVSNNNQTVTFSQSSGALLNYTQYQIVIKPSQIKNIHNNPMGSATESAIASFTTGDYIAPTVSSTSPVNGATAVSRLTAINIAFSESMTQSTLTTSNILLQTQAGVTVASYSLSYNPATYMVTLAPALALESNTSYKILLNQPNITDLNGNAMGSNSTYQLAQFTTDSTTVPTLSSLTPINGAINVVNTTSISLTFSVAMNTATLTASNIKLQRVADSSYVTLNTPAYSNGNKTVVFQPSTSLNAPESYNIIIDPSQIKDESANSMGAATALTVSNFYTFGWWAKQVGASGGSTTAYGIAVDSNGNNYIVGTTSVGLSGQTQSGTSDYFIAKYNNTGALQWSRQVGASGGSSRARAVAIDTTGNSYLVGFTTVGLSGQTQNGTLDYLIAKYNNAGVLQWSRQVGASGGTANALGVTVSNSGVVYVTGNTNKGLSGKTLVGKQDYFIAKYDSSGNLQGAYQFGAAGATINSFGIKVDSSGNSYVAGDTDTALIGQRAGNIDYFVAKYNNAGVNQWTAESGGSGGRSYISNTSLDSSGNTYVVGYTEKSISNTPQAGTDDYFIAKYNNIGQRQWIKQVGATGGITYGWGVGLGSSESVVYVSGSSNVGISGQVKTGNYDGFIAIYNNSGDLLKTNLLGSSGGILYLRSIGLDSNNTPYITGNTNVGVFGQSQSGSNDYFAIKYFMP